MESAGVLFTIAMAFITGGIAMLTENVWIYLVDVAAEVLLKKEKSYSNEIIGLGLLIIGLVFLFVSFRNWKIKISSDLHEKVSAVVHAYYTTLHMRERSFNRNLWKEQHAQVNRLYVEATEYIDKNKIKIDKSTAEEGRAILFKCTEENEAFGHIIVKMDNLIAGTLTYSYDPNEDFKYSKGIADQIKERFFILQENFTKS